MAITTDTNPMPERITQRKVAKQLGLTQATVSLALRNDPRIPEERRIEIQNAAKAMGYQPSPAASALAQMRHTSTVKPRRAAVAWLNFWRDLDQLRKMHEYELYFHGAAAAAEKFGFHLEEFRCGNEMSLKRLESILIARGIEGIFLPPHRRMLDLSGFNWNKFSVIKFGRSLLEPNVQVVTADQLHNSKMAYEKIRAKGYQRVGFVDSKIDYWHFDAGILKAQREVSEPERIPILYLAKNSPATGSAEYREELRSLESWLDSHQPEAIFTSSRNLMSMLKELGRRVPEDIAVAGTSLRECQVDAGIDQNAREIGRVAMLTLISLLHDNDRGVPSLYRETLVKGNWVDGQSLPEKA